jgi:hypothetical protein
MVAVASPLRTLGGSHVCSGMPSYEDAEAAKLKHIRSKPNALDWGGD